MGKLTDSLKATTKQLGEIKQGVNHMKALGQELADNTLHVADAALRAGYAYAKAELEATANPTEVAQVQPALPSAPTGVLDADQLGQATRWTKQSLSDRFGNHQAAYRHLKEVHQRTLKSRSWDNIVDAFNGVVDDLPLAQRVTQLEQTIVLQAQHIAALEAKLNEVVLRLQEMSKA